MYNYTMLIKQQNKLRNEKQYADAQASYHKKLYEKFTELSTKYEQELKAINDELEAHISFSTDVENSIKAISLYCKVHKRYGNCSTCKIKTYCKDYTIEEWENVK